MDIDIIEAAKVRIVPSGNGVKQAMQDAGASETGYQQQLRETGLFRYVGYDPVFDFVSRNYREISNTEAVTSYILALGKEFAEGQNDLSGPHGQDIQNYLRAKMLDGLESSGLFEGTIYADYLTQMRSELGEQAGQFNIDNYVDAGTFWQGQGVLDSFNPDRPRVSEDQGFIIGALAWLGIVDKPSTQQEEYVSELLTRSGLTLGEIATLIYSARGGSATKAGGTSAAGKESGKAGAVAGTDGLAYRYDLPAHLAGPDGFTKSGLLNGTHNLKNATIALDSKGASYTLNSTGTAGVSELQYSYKNSAGKIITGSKTVYDPSVYSDKMMLDMSLSVGQRAYNMHIGDTSRRIFDLNQNGVNFRVYINTDTKTGLPFVGNVHPIK